jgi:hypothetical protein
MEIYENSYTKNEDYMLWELHEIRNRLHNFKKGKSITEINNEAMKKFKNWKEEFKHTKESLKRA